MLNIPVQTLLLAFGTGAVPTFLWLWFWLKQDEKKPEPRGLLTLVFIAGALIVILILPLQRFLAGLAVTPFLSLWLLAGSEEATKWFATQVVALRTTLVDEPIDYVVYLVTASLGFAALENTLFLLNPATRESLSLTLVTGNLRFLGATLLHSIAAAVLGIFMGSAHYLSKTQKILYFVVGLSAATTLHALFNFFIIQGTGKDIGAIFGVLWVIVVLVLFMFERLKHVHQTYNGAMIDYSED